MENNEVVKVENGGGSALVQSQEFTRDQIDTIKNTIAIGTSDEELDLFIATCKRTGLDPFARQIYAIMRWNKKAGREILSIQTSIDGFRMIAERSRKYRGQTTPVYYDQDGNEFEVWLQSYPPSACKVGVLRSDFDQPLFAIALWTSFVQKFQDGNPSGLWGKMPEVMLAKVAESQALRKAFPQDLSGLYTTDEMAQTNNADQNNDFQRNEFERMRSHTPDTNSKKGENKPGKNGKRATKKQLEFLKKLSQSSHLTPDEQANLNKALDSDISAKQASDLLEKVQERINDRKVREREIEDAEVIEPEIEGPKELTRYHEDLISGIMLKFDWTRAKTRAYVDANTKKTYDLSGYLELDRDGCADFLERVNNEEFLPF